MSGAGVFWLIVLLIVLGIGTALVVQARKEAQIMATGTNAEREALAAKRARAAAAVAANQAQKAANVATQVHGSLRPQMVCPHCQERGKVMCKAVKNKREFPVVRQLGLS